MKKNLLVICGIHFFQVLVLGIIGAACVTYAVPPPLATLSTPTSLSPGQSTVGLGAGSAASLFPGAHAGGHAWFGRWRIGVLDRLDLGLDVMGIERSKQMALTGKGAMGFDLWHWLRLEAGLGAADDSDGKSIGGEVGLVIRTTDARASWGFYGALRFAGALSVTDDRNEEQGSETPDQSPSAFFALGAVGTSARLSDWARFNFEAGSAGIFVDGYPDVGVAIYVGVGLLFQVPTIGDQTSSKSKQVD